MRRLNTGPAVLPIVTNEGLSNAGQVIAVTVGLSVIIIIVVKVTGKVVYWPISYEDIMPALVG